MTTATYETLSASDHSAHSCAKRSSHRPSAPRSNGTISSFTAPPQSIGIWGAVILTVLRMIQGIGVGGEWGGSVLSAIEWSRHHGQRGLVASWPQFGVPCGLFLSNLRYWLSALGQAINSPPGVGESRSPSPSFLVGVGLWIRLGILETPVFRQLLNTRRIEKASIVEVVKKQPKEIILSALLRMAEQAPFYIFTAFIFAYSVCTLDMSRNLILSAVLVAACVSFVSIPLSGQISDRIGRKKMYLIGAATVGWFGFLHFRDGGHRNPLGGVHRDCPVVDPA